MNDVIDLWEVSAAIVNHAAVLSLKYNGASEYARAVHITHGTYPHKLEV